MLPGSRPRAVIFDLDGVLLDTEPLYTQATQAVVGEWGKVFDWSVKADMIGRAALDGARYLVERLALPITPEEYIARSEPRLEALFENVAAMPGAEALVTSLAGRRPIAVATSSVRRLYEIKVAPHPWFARFDAIVAGDDARVRALKPAPDIFLVAAERLGVDPAECVVIEDALAGVQAARAAGMRVIAMPDAHVDRARYAAADVIAASLDEVARLIG